MERDWPPVDEENKFQITIPPRELVCKHCGSKARVTDTPVFDGWTGKQEGWMYGVGFWECDCGEA